MDQGQRSNWVDDHLKFSGRIDRDEWIKQCKAFAKESAATAKETCGEKALPAKKVQRTPKLPRKHSAGKTAQDALPNAQVSTARLKRQTAARVASAVADRIGSC